MIKNYAGTRSLQREGAHGTFPFYSGKYLVYILGETKLENQDIVLENSSCV